MQLLSRAWKGTLVRAASQTPHHHPGGGDTAIITEQTQVEILTISKVLRGRKHKAEPSTASTQVPFPPALKEKTRKEAKGKGHPDLPPDITSVVRLLFRTSLSGCTAPSTVYPMPHFLELISWGNGTGSIPIKQTNQANMFGVEVNSFNLETLSFITPNL